MLNLSAMKARTKKVAKSPSAKKPMHAQQKWRLEDLPLAEQVELEKRLRETENGKGLVDFDEALKKADRMTEEILTIVDSPSKNKSVA